MNVFRHVNERHQVQGSLFAGRIHTTRQPSTPIIIRQQRHPPITREGQLVKVTGLVVMFDSFSVRLIARHAAMGMILRSTEVSKEGRSTYRTRPEKNAGRMAPPSANRLGVGGSIHRQRASLRSGSTGRASGTHHTPQLVHNRRAHRQCHPAEFQHDLSLIVREYVACVAADP